MQKPHYIILVISWHKRNHNNLILNMKHFFTLLLAIIGLPLGIMAQGWPANYGGVMLQGFYWDSYTDTQWANFTSQADTLSKYFKLIWVPQSGWCNSSYNMGYYPIYWFNQKSAFGSEQELRTMISTLKAKGTGVIADVVVNHKNGVSKWCDFANETVTGTNTGKTYSVTWDNTSYTQICKDDEANTSTSSEAYGKIKGAADTGLGEGGCRDLDHTNATTQQNIKTYEDFLLNEMGYTGFRYDFVKGFDPKYVQMYNESSKPQFSVGEYWQGTVTDSKSGDHPFGGVKDWVEATGKTSAAFDFPMKYLIKDAFGGNWKELANYTSRTLVAKEPQYAVTFIDNHDTGEPHSNPDPQRANIEAANAYILAMPGTPCVWLSHWQSYKYTIKRCILARNIAGVTNTSSVTKSEGQTSGYVLIVKGDKGNVLLLLGSPTYDTTGYQLACEGENFKYYVSNGLDISEINKIKQESSGYTIPSFCTVNDGEICAFFEQPISSDWQGDIYCWAWDSNGNFTNKVWPGSKCEQVGTTSEGKSVWKWTWDGKYYKNNVATTTTSTPTNIIFTNKTKGTKQTNDMQFKNGNYYGVNVVYGNVIDNATGISNIKANTQSGNDAWYSLSGSRMTTKPTQKGVYIHQGKKVVIK